GPQLLHSCWQYEIAKELMRFYAEFEAGRKPMLVLQAPPQHGKTEQVTDFIAWCAGKNPNLKSMFTSYSDDLGIRVNLSLQRIFDGPRYKKVWANTKLSETNVVTMSGRFLRNSTLLEFVGYGGSFRNTTVLGQINGQGLDLGFVDDPVKGRKEAYSPAVRDSTWHWL